MRRKDREVTDEAEIRDIIRSARCCRLGFNDGGKVYIVPLSYGWEYSGGAYSFYFHGAREGRKIDCIRRNPYAAFEIDCDYELRRAETASAHSAYYRSVMGEGTVSFVDDMQEKRRALELLMLHTAGKGGWSYPDAVLENVCVFRLSVTELSCKEHLKQPLH